MITHTANIMQALSRGPRLAAQLGPVEHIASRVRTFNDAHKDMGSHWRVRGRTVYVSDRATGIQRVTEYRLVME